MGKLQLFSNESGRRRQVWIVVLLAAMLFVAGVASSVATATSVARHDADKSRQAFTVSSLEVASTLRLAIQREQDLAVSASGFFLDTPHPSNDEFVAWAEALQAMTRYPELLGWGEVIMVPAAQLPAYVAAATADPAGVVAGGFQLIPPGEREFYCLFVVGQSRNPAAGAPAGFDYCAGANGALTLAARDTGRSGYEAVDTGNGTTTLGVQVPIYRGGVTPTTVAARRE
ncbi:MAG TPA: CHASE domain-containing protein, partial [Ilumatobacteraceae bacterium]|nr:CHASE domain-containing protein [Ilumatobacteraceae bacterium]